MDEKQFANKIQNDFIAERIRGVVEESRLSYQTIAESIGVSRQAISQYCDGSTVPNSDKLYRIAQFFNVSADYLLGIQEDNNSDASDSIIVVTEMKNLPDYCCECNLYVNGKCVIKKEPVADWRPFWCPLRYVHDGRIDK